MIRLLKNSTPRQRCVVALFFFVFLLVVALWPTKIFAADDLLWEVLKNYENKDSLGGHVYAIWGTFMKLVNGFVVVVLIAVAFAQILRLNINTYGVKKVLPTLVLAIIAANFSFLFCRLMVDLSSVIISLFIQGPDGKATNAEEVVGVFSNIGDNLPNFSGGPCEEGKTANCYTYGTLFWQGLANLMIFAGGVVLFILAYLFIIRNWLIYFLTAMAPLGFMALVLPQTKSLFNQWWTNFSKWVFMPVVSVFWIWVGSLWFTIIQDGGGTFMSFVFVGVCFYLAITTPFKMGGAVMSAWGNMGKKAWGRTGGAAWNATGGAGIKAGQQWVGDKYSNVKRTGTNWAKDNVPVVKQWSRAANRGRLRQATVNSYFEDKDKTRQQQAFLDFMNTKEFRSKGGFKDPVLKKLKGQAATLFMNDEWNHEVYNGFKNADLIKRVPKVNDGGTIRNATLEDVANQGLTLLERDGVTTFKNNGDRITAAKEMTAATKELLQRRKGARNSADNIAGSTDPYNSIRPNDIIEAEGLNVDPRIMASSAVGTPSAGGGQASGSQSASQGGSEAQQSVNNAQQNIDEIIKKNVDTNIAHQYASSAFVTSARKGKSFEEAKKDKELEDTGVSIDSFGPDAQKELEKSYNELAEAMRESGQSFSLSDYTRGLRGTAGNKTEAIIENLANTKSGQLNESTLQEMMKDMSPEEQAYAKTHFDDLKQMSGMIDETMEANGSNKELENVDTGLYVIKDLMDKANNTDVEALERYMANALRPLEESEKNGKLNEAGVAEKKRYEDGLLAIQKIKEQGKTISSDTLKDPEQYDTFKKEVVSAERSKNRKEIIYSSEISDKTIATIASTNTNVPLEQINIDTSINHLNQSIESLISAITENTGTENRPAQGIDSKTMANMEAMKLALKENQSGLKEDFKGAMQALFGHGYNGKDSLSNPAVARIFANELSTRLSQRLSRTPLKTQITNMPKNSGTHPATTPLPTSSPQPQVQTTPIQTTPIQTTPPQPKPGTQWRLPTNKDLK